MNTFKNHAGFSISNSKLQVVEINCTNNHFFLKNVDEAFFNEVIDFKNDKETKIGSLLQSAFDEIVLKNPLETKFSSFTLPQELFYITQIPYDNTLLHDDLTEELKWELSVLYPQAPTNDLLIQYIEIEKNKLVDYNTVLVVGLNRRYLKIIKNFCYQNNLKLIYTDNLFLAAERALNVITSSKVIGLTLSAYYSSNILSLIFSYERKPFLFKSIRVNNVSEIPAKIVKEINTKDKKIAPDQIDTAYISGENLSPALINSIKDVTTIDFIQYNPFEKLTPEPDIYNNPFFGERYNSFTSAAGIAMRAI
ncbi:MAG: hypothetical protein CO128_05185 [Ignavibacteriales bacterium CG_4_9_14_3_um_filter_30_11]|nr:MAG: hypothetical protein CO128_05185 [Ignavibacteriales bacterium CG_4_9_14_3_um_filter_30_11]